MDDIATYLLQHHHAPAECRAAFAAWKGFESCLRGSTVLGTCRRGGHTLWATVEAPDAHAALVQMPPYLADRTVAVEVTRLVIP